MKLMHSIAIIGDRDSVLGFRALGLSVFSADTAEQARPILHKLARSGVPVIYLTETLAVQMKAELDRYQDAPSPSIIPIPGKSGSLGFGMNRLKDAVERAVGADIL